MDETVNMLVRQFLLRVRQEGFSLKENPPRNLSSELNIDIYRADTKLCTFDDRQLGEKWTLRLHTDDSTRADIRGDYSKLHSMFIYLRDLYMVYDTAVPLQGYDYSLDYRAIAQFNNCTLAVRSMPVIAAIEFGTFITEIRNNGYRDEKTILRNIHFEMDNYPAAKRDFVVRSGLLPREQIVTPENIIYLHGSCSKTMAREGALFDEETKNALGRVITDLDRAKDSFRDVEYRTSAIPAKNARFIETKILAVNGIFTRQRIDRTSLPKGMFVYDIQQSRDEMTPVRVCSGEPIPRFGTVITRKSLPIGERGFTELGEADFTLNPEKKSTLREFQTRGTSAR